MPVMQADHRHCTYQGTAWFFAPGWVESFWTVWSWAQISGMVSTPQRNMKKPTEGIPAESPKWTDSWVSNIMFTNKYRVCLVFNNNRKGQNHNKKLYQKLLQNWKHPDMVMTNFNKFISSKNKNYNIQKWPNKMKIKIMMPKFENINW